MKANEEGAACQMTITHFEYLFTPIQIRDLTIRNRIVSTGHGTALGERGLPTERMIRYHSERAKGGIGLIIVEAAGVHRSSRCPLMLTEERAIPAFRALTDAVHAEGAKIFLQTAHLGRQRISKANRLTWAPSAMPYLFYDEIGLTPKEMEIEDIAEVVDAWGNTAALARTAGFDGVEIHSTYGGYLLSAFLSPYSNRRSDQYGGSLDNRMRIVLEVIDSIRAKTGDDYVVGMQLNGDDLTPSGLGPEDYQEIARRIDETGKIDYLVVKAGTYWVPNMVIPDMQHALALWVPYAAEIKDITDRMTIIAVGRINDPILAERILADGQADMVGMTRAQIADPELANKAREGRLEDIRPCVACNIGCFAGTYGTTSCIHNPAAGNEGRLGIGTLKPASTRKRVIVIGGGPAGLKAAEVAARRGHSVALYERRPELGGQVNIAAKGAGRAPLQDITRHLSRQLPKLGVDIHLGTEVSADMVLGLSPDAVVVATGSLPRRVSFTGIPPFDPDDPVPHGFGQPNVLTTWDLLEQEAAVGENVVVADDGEGNWKAASIAELLLDRGSRVELITPLESPFKDITAERRVPLLRRILRKGLVITPYTAIKEIDGRTVVTYNIYSRQVRRIEDIDNVVLAYYGQANDSLYYGLKGRVKALHRIGDCVAPRTIGDAIREGETVGRLL